MVRGSRMAPTLLQGDDVSVGAIGQIVQRLQRKALLQKLHRAIRQANLRAAGMGRLNRPIGAVVEAHTDTDRVERLVVEATPCLAQFVDVRRGDRRTMIADVGPAEIIGQDDHKC